MTARRVVFEGSVLARGPITGVGRSFLTTLRRYAAGERCALLLPASHHAAIAAELPAGVELVAAPADALGKRLRLPGLLRRLGAGLLHVPVAAAPGGVPCPVLVTIHDLPWRAASPLGASDGCSRRHRRAVRRAAAAAAVVVPSASTAAAVRAELGPAVAGRLHVVPHAVDVGQEPPAAIDQPGPLVVLGDDRPRKNHERLRRAWQLARSRDRSLPPLRFVGPPDHYVTEAEKHALLRRARALVHVSLHEGFGLPVLEAMTCGVPVVCSDRGGLAELTAGGTALVVDPLDVDAIAGGMVRIHGDAELRAALRRRGLLLAAGHDPGRGADAWRSIHDLTLTAGRRR